MSAASLLRTLFTSDETSCIVSSESGAGTSNSKCPAGSASVAVTVPASAGQPIANVPPAGGNPDNLEGPVWINGWLYLSEIAKRGSHGFP